jgi:hypothetical protein
MMSESKKQPSLFPTQKCYCGPASPPGAPPKLQGASIIAWLPLGAACKIGSTPLSNVIAVPPLFAVPCVVTMSTASPLCKSAIVTAGMRLNIC